MRRIDEIIWRAEMNGIVSAEEADTILLACESIYSLLDIADVPKDFQVNMHNLMNDDELKEV